MSNEQLKISVVVPVYNVEDYLKKCVESLLNQTMPQTDYNVILVDDGSTDSSGKICDEFQKSHPSVITAMHKKNGGLSDARNYGMKQAKGKYILFIDSDDYVEPQMFERMYALSQNGNKKIVECNFIWEFEDKSKNDIRLSYKSLKDYLVEGRVVAWNKLYLREWLNEIHVEFPFGKLYEDQPFFFKLVACLNDISEVAVDQWCEVHYIQRSSSISNSETDKITDIIADYSDILNFYSEKNCLDTYHDELEYRFIRNLLGNVLIRKVIKIQDKAVKAKILDFLWGKVQSWFPEWKKNKYLQGKSLVNFYLKFMNLCVYTIFYLF